MLVIGAPPRGTCAANGTTFLRRCVVRRILPYDSDFLLRVAVEKLAGEPTEDIIHDRFRHRDIGILGEARRLETHMAELVD